MWEQGIENALLSDADRATHYVKFNERALLRGTLKDQSDMFAKALGAGGQSPWMTPNEIRELQDLPRIDDPAADSIENPMTRTANVTPETA